MNCDEAKSLVEDRDKGIKSIETVLADPEVGPAIRARFKKTLISAYLDRALIVAANPSCFPAARLKEAHKITDAREQVGLTSASGGMSQDPIARRS